MTDLNDLWPPGSLISVSAFNSIDKSCPLRTCTSFLYVFIFFFFFFGKIFSFSPLSLFKKWLGLLPVGGNSEVLRAGFSYLPAV